MNNPGDEPMNERDLLSSILESGFDAILTKTLDGTITSWNAGATKIYGYTAQEIIGRNVAVLSPPGHVNEMPDILTRLQRGEGVDHYETERLRKDGTVINVSVSVSPLRSKSGEITGAATIARDVTAEYRLSRYARSLIESSLDPFVTISPDGKITDVNEATVKVTGIGRENLVGTDFSVYFTDPEKAREGYRLVFARGYVTDYPLTIRHRDEHLTDVLYNASVYKDAQGNVLGVFAAARDVTERLKNEAKLSGLLESAPDAMVIVDEEGAITMVNTQTEVLFGYEHGEILGSRIEILIPDRFRERHLGHRTGYIADPRVRAMGTGLELFGLRKDGTEVPVEIKLSPMRLKDELLITATIRDVTEQKQASRYARGLIEASLDPLVTINTEGKITDVNEATVRVTGVARENLVGTDFSNYFTEPSKAQAGYREAFARGFVTDYPLTIRHKAGRLTDVLYNASVYKDLAGSVLGIFAAARDITAMKRAEHELADQRRREQERLLELERFQKLTVGRELKMIELKNEIRDLQQENADLRQRLAP